MDFLITQDEHKTAQKLNPFVTGENLKAINYEPNYHFGYVDSWVPEEKDKIFLKSSNPKYPTITSDNIKVVGKLIYLVREYRS